MQVKDIDVQSEDINWSLCIQATYEIQYGALRRPTHYNSTVDSAKFEVYLPNANK